jgi:hypothetical protein
LNPDDRFVFKHRKQIVESFDFEVGRLGPDDLVDRDPGRRIDCQLGRNQVRIARLVGLGMEAFGQDHFQGRRVLERQLSQCLRAAASVPHEGGGTGRKKWY